MKVISGKDLKTSVIKCTECGSLLEITVDDVNRDDVSFYVTCPECGEKIYVKESKKGDKFIVDDFYVFKG